MNKLTRGLKAGIKGYKAAVEETQARQQHEQRVRTPRSGTRSIVLVVVGVFLFIAVVLDVNHQWNTRRVVDIGLMHILAFVGGIASTLVGLRSFFKSSPTSQDSPPPVGTSVEDRLRRLDDLRAKHLISDAEYEQRKKEIIGSL